jgi:hypothetical protein
VYDVLHTSMEQVGFSRQITSDSGTTYQLPLAESFCEGNLTVWPVRSAALAAQTGRVHAVLDTDR